MYSYEIIFELAKNSKDLPLDFSFKEGKYRAKLNHAAETVNQKGRVAANPKHIGVLDDKTKKTELYVKLDSQQKLDMPSRACKSLSRELIQDEEFKALLSGGGPKGKLLVGKGWRELTTDNPHLEGPDLMRELTTILMRMNESDRHIVEQISDILVAYREERI